MEVTRANASIAQELNILIAKSTPYALSSPSFGSPTLHDFVKGFILSTNILEVIDEHLPNGYGAEWGQVIDKEDGNTLSKECDIIIYEGKQKPFKNKRMTFVLADKKSVKVVIQAKSSIHSVTKDDKNYCRELKKFVPEVWYIAECCWAESKTRAETIRRELKRAGYDQFFYFYRMNGSLARTIDHEPFIKFINLVEKIK